MKCKAQMILKGLIIIPAMVVLVACQGILLTFDGKPVAPEARIVLKTGGPHMGNWETDHLYFNYDYLWKSGSIEFSGDLALKYPLLAYEFVDYLFFRINFIDGDGNLIESRVAWSNVYQNNFYDHESWSVKFSMNPPPETTAIGFSYMGRLQEAGRDGSDWYLWKSPLG